MGISDLIASFLQDSLDTAENGVLEVQRSDLAQRFNCVPSQINYVMSTRFSPERGYIVESRRGGNGYIRITRVRVDRETLLMHVINSLGGSVTCPPHGRSSATWYSPALWTEPWVRRFSQPWGTRRWGRYREKSGTPFGRIFSSRYSYYRCSVCESTQYS